MNILLTGGSGLIGTKLAKKLEEAGHQVRILTRKKEVKHPYYTWGNDFIDEKAFEDLDGIIHLAGATLSKRWTKSYRKNIFDSRILTAKLLYKYIKDLKSDLQFFISASGAGYYGQITSNKIFVEEDTAGMDFLGKICSAWEESAHCFTDFSARVVCVRTSFVLAKNGSGFELLKKPIKFGIGTNLGSGKQWMPWIHIDDLVGIYVSAVENKEMVGEYNAAAPEKINHSTFNRTLAKRMHKPFFLPSIPFFLVRLILGDMSDIILKGSRLSSEKITKTGFNFSYPTLNKALDELLK